MKHARAEPGDSGVRIGGGRGSAQAGPDYTGWIMAIETIHELDGRGINLKSLTEPEIDTTTAMGPALFGIVAVFTQFRVDAIRENTVRGLAHARAEGRVGGRPTVMTPERVEAAHLMRAEGMSLARIAQALGVGRSTVARAITREETVKSIQ